MINEYLTGLKSIFDKLDMVAIQRAIDLIGEINEYHNMPKRRLWIMGNGGSSSTASHFSCDLFKNTSKGHGKRFITYCLSDNVPMVTAYANDEGYQNVFMRQLEDVAHSQDIVFAISASGNSPNVVTAVQCAKDNHIPVIGLTGFDGGKLRQLADISIHVDSDIIEQVEDVHLMICHIIVKSFKG